MIVFGTIKDFEGNMANVEVAEHDNSVYSCYILQPLTGKNKIDFPFAKNDLVCVLLADGRNLILGAVYNDVDTRDSDAGEDTYVFQAKKIFAKAEEKFQFNDGLNGGLIIIQNLVNKINAIENKMTNHQHYYELSGVPTLTTTAGTQEITPTTTVEDLENDKITH